MANKKQEDAVVRLVHVNGATVSVPADRAEAVVATGVFSEESARKTAPKSGSDK